MYPLRKVFLGLVYVIENNDVKQNCGNGIASSKKMLDGVIQSSSVVVVGCRWVLDCGLWEESSKLTQPILKKESWKQS